MSEHRGPVVRLALCAAAGLAVSGCGNTSVPVYRAYVLPADGCIRPDCSDLREGPRPSRHATSDVASYAQPPAFDSQVTCHASKEFGGSYCLTDEKTAQSQIKRRWASFGVAERRSCVEQTRSYNPSYVETLTCLELSQGSTPPSNPFVPYVSPTNRGPLPDSIPPDEPPK